MFAARGLGTFLSTYFMAYVGRYVIHTLRCNVFDHMLHLPGRFFDHHSSGHLVSRVTYHVEQVAGAATKGRREGVVDSGADIGAMDEPMAEDLSGADAAVAAHTAEA